MGDGDDDDGSDDGRIFPEHPSPIIHAPRDIISRKGKSLTPTIDDDGDDVKTIRCPIEANLFE